MGNKEKNFFRKATFDQLQDKFVGKIPQKV